jgi:chromosome segregation ATPase
MDFEQIIKRLDWLDEEHRKDKTLLATLEERFKGSEGNLNRLQARVKELGKVMAPLSDLAARFDQFDQILGQQRVDLNRFIDETKKRHADLSEASALHRADLDEIHKSIVQIRKSMDAIKELKREIKTRTEEDIRLGHEMTAIANKFEETMRTIEEIQRTQHLAEETRRQDVKRQADLQGEVSAIRKQRDEGREKDDLLSDNIRRTEIRLTELLASEAERRQMQTNFIETQSRLQTERERVWKEWELRFETLTKQSDELEIQLRDWDTAQRAVKRAQETYDDIIQKFERRINEIVEMQRLAEDHARQEWVSFKADDQKRWTNYTLSQEETLKDTRSNVERLEERLTTNEDLAQMQKDVSQQTKEANEQMLQALLAQIHELLSAYERIMGTTK